jgi:hypothetical protein
MGTPRQKQAEAFSAKLDPTPDYIEAAAKLGGFGRSAANLEFNSLPLANLDS